MNRQPTPRELQVEIVRLRRGLRVMAVGLLCAILFLGALGGLAIWNASRIDNKTQDTLVHNQRCDLLNRIGQSEQFLEERSAMEPGLADYIRRVTLPDLRKRLKSLPRDGNCEAVPSAR